jgi:hypothetical protein
MVAGASVGIHLAGSNAPPKLEISQLSGTVVIAWPTIIVDFALEMTEGLQEQIHWESVTNAAVVVGHQNTVTLQATNLSRFYRLRRQ